MPNDLSPYLNQSHKKAGDFFKQEPYYTIKPILHADYSCKTFLLPQFLTLALIDSTSTFDEHSMMASIRVIWWQDQLGLPEDHIIEEIKKSHGKTHMLLIGTSK